MEREINEISTSRMNNGAHFLFMTKVVNRAEGDAAVMNKCATLVANLRVALDKEDECLKISEKSHNTDGIAQADRERDSLYIALKLALQGFSGLAVPAMASAAKHLNQLMVDYQISPKMQLDQETGLLINFIADLEGKNASDVATLGLGVMVANLKEANQRVIDLTEARDEERMGKIVGAMKAARAATDDAYRRLVKTVNAFAWIEGDNTELDDFITYVNVQVVHYRREVLGEGADAADGLPPTGDENDSPTGDPAEEGEPSSGSSENSNENEGDNTTTPGDTPTPPAPSEGEGGNPGGSDPDDEIVG